MFQQFSVLRDMCWAHWSSDVCGYSNGYNYWWLDWRIGDCRDRTRSRGAVLLARGWDWGCKHSGYNHVRAEPVPIVNDIIWSSTFSMDLSRISHDNWTQNLQFLYNVIFCMLDSLCLRKARVYEAAFDACRYMYDGYPSMTDTTLLFYHFVGLFCSFTSLPIELSVFNVKIRSIHVCNP